MKVVLLCTTPYEEFTMGHFADVYIREVSYFLYPTHTHTRYFGVFCPARLKKHVSDPYVFFSSFYKL